MDDIDEIDLHILAALQEDGRLSHSELAQRVGLAPPTIQRRVRLLEERGYIRGYTARLDPLSLGLMVTAFIFIETHAGCEPTTLEGFLAARPEIQEVHRLIGEWCYLIKVRTHSPQTLEVLLYRDLRSHPAIRRTMSVLATSSTTETAALPLPRKRVSEQEKQ